MGPIDVYLVRYAYPILYGSEIIYLKGLLQRHVQMTMPSIDARQLQHVMKWRFLTSPFFSCHFSQFEEKFEEINGVDVAPKLPSSPDVSKHQSPVVPEDRGKDIEMQEQEVPGPSSDFTTSQDFVSGIMKIVPSDVAVSITSVCEAFVLCIAILRGEYIYCKLWGKSASYRLWQHSLKLWGLSFETVRILLHILIFLEA